jgi:hypothetical protein
VLCDAPDALHVVVVGGAAVGVQASFANGDNCYSNGAAKPRTLAVQFQCTPNALLANPPFTVLNYPPQSCNW